MSSCCSVTPHADAHPKKHACPANGNVYGEVSLKTIKHHISQPWSWTPTSKHYYFCSDPECDVVYFGSDDCVIFGSELKTQISGKAVKDSDLYCYCFGVTKGDYKNNPSIKDFVIEQTKNGQCSCQTSNPSGLCCLKDFPKT